MRLRLAPKKDIEPLVAILQKTFSKADANKARSEILEILASPQNRPTFVVAVEGSHILGLAGLVQSWLDFNIYELIWVAVNPDYQKRGIGAQVVLELVKRAKRFKGHSQVNTILLSTDSPGFFSKCGFKKVAALENHCFLMCLQLV